MKAFRWLPVVPGESQPGRPELGTQAVCPLFTLTAPGDLAEKPPGPPRPTPDARPSLLLRVLSLHAQDSQETVWTVWGADKLGPPLG